MFLKTTLDAEKEELFAFLWLFPLLPLLAVLILCLCHGHFSWMLLLIAFFWFIVWGYIYRNTHTEIYFEDKKITLKLRKTIYTLSVADIKYVEENTFLTNPLRTHTYKVYMQPNTNIPVSYLFIRNREIQKNFTQLFPNIPVKKNIIL